METSDHLQSKFTPTKTPILEDSSNEVLKREPTNSKLVTKFKFLEGFNFKLFFLVFLLTILSLVLIDTVFLKNKGDSNQEETTDLEIEISVTPEPTITGTLEATPTAVVATASEKYIVPTKVSTKAPTTVPTVAPSPTAKPPMPTVTPVPEPLVMRISYPQEGQYIEMNDTQTLCVVDVPVSGSHQDMQVKRNINGSGWTGYEAYHTYCYDPVDGPNTFEIQYKNGLGQETGVYKVNFTFKRI